MSWGSTASKYLSGFSPRASDYANFRRDWRKDVLAGIAVGVVALPLALAFGITTGLGAAAGLITAIVAGFLAAIFGGSNFQVSGPTGAMTVVLVPIVAQYGPRAVPFLGLLAGVLVMCLGIFKVGRFVAAIPWPVVEGFTLGIATVIGLQQIPLALDIKKPDGSNAALVAISSINRAVRTGVHWQALLIAAIALLLMILLPRITSKVPASIVAVVVCTVAAQVAHFEVSRIGKLPRSLPLPHLPHMTLSSFRDILSAAVAVAALSAIESLLAARVADGMADLGPRDRHDPDRELFGQGIATAVASVMGGMPATGAIARTAVNVRAGASSRIASMVHALLLLLVVLFFAPLVGHIPTAALAGVLIGTAFRMVDPRSVISAVKSTRSDALVLGVTAVLTVAVDLIVAVEVGLVLAGINALRHLVSASAAVQEYPHIDSDLTGKFRALDDHIATYRFDGALFFGAAHYFVQNLIAIGGVKVVVLRLGGLQVLDASGAQAFGEIVHELESRHVTVLIEGVSERHRGILERSGALEHVRGEKHIFATLEAALEHARAHVHRSLHNN